MSTKDEIRQAAEQDFPTFIRLIAPEQVFGLCHEEVMDWWERPESKSHQLLLFPRDHQKSRLVAYRVAWYLTKDPCLRVLYISATAALAEKQLYFIKNIFTSPTYMRYWPEHVNKEEGLRDRWTTTEINLDHPERKRQNIRDPSIRTGGLTTVHTGFHCDISVLDDVVVYENAYTDEGRSKVESQYSLLTSIEGAEARQWVVGTRYHPKDLYGQIMTMTQDLYNDNGEIIGDEPIYEIFAREVEDSGDGTGEFLWPRQQRKDGKWFGFDLRILARKRGQYLDKGQFKAQYYNDPTDPDNVPVDRSRFQYYDRKHLNLTLGNWYYKDAKLNLFSSIDFAFSLNKRADYTAITVVGVDSENNVYVLDIERFRTDSISEYFKKILQLQTKWSFRKLRAEVNVAQQAIVKQLKEEIRRHGLKLSIDEFRPTSRQGSKEERIAAILEPRYENGQIWHYKGGYCQVLEEELMSRNPPHDDVKDSLASAIDVAVKPARNFNKQSNSIVWASHRFRGAS